MTLRRIIRLGGMGCLALLILHGVKYMGWLELPSLALHPIVAVTGVLIWVQAEQDWRK